MINNSLVKKIVAIMFVGLIFLGFLRTDGFYEIINLSGFLSQKENDPMVYDYKPTTLDELEKDFSDNLLVKDKLIDINGTLAKSLNIRGFYSDLGLYVTDNNYIVSASDYTTTDYEFVQTVQFKDFLESNGINFIYVNKPTKYVDDSLFEEEFGIKTYSNQNADIFLDRIRNNGVPTIDLRDNIKEENIDVLSLFYRTDHHWTAPAGLWATKIIAEGLNEYCGYDIDTSIYDEDRYVYTTWENCWLGEQGRLISKAYVGLDDFTKLVPVDETEYLFKDYYGNEIPAVFDDFIDDRVFNTENNVYVNKSWHYAYEIHDCINENVDYGKILIIGDSYDFITQPLLSLGVHEVDAVILRQYEESFSLMDYVLENGYDTVILAYAQFTIGTHDDPSSGGYQMFNLNR